MARKASALVLMDSIFKDIDKIYDIIDDVYSQLDMKQETLIDKVGSQMNKLEVLFDENGMEIFHKVRAN